MTASYNDYFHSVVTRAFGERLSILISASDFSDIDVSELLFNYCPKGEGDDYHLITSINMTPSLVQFLQDIAMMEELGMFLVEEEKCVALAWNKIDALCALMKHMEDVALELNEKKDPPQISPYPGDKSFKNDIRNNEDLLYFINNQQGYTGLTQLFKETMLETIKFEGMSVTHPIEHILAIAARNEIPLRVNKTSLSTPTKTV